MKEHIEKSIDVDIELAGEEIELLFDAFDLLERISEKVEIAGLEEDDVFTISWMTEDNRYTSRSTSLEDLSELRARFDEVF